MYLFSEPNSFTQFNHLKKFISDGGSLIYFASDGGEWKSGSNMNFFLEEYGISVNNGKVD